jgi:hypothetical protein
MNPRVIMDILSEPQRPSICLMNSQLEQARLGLRNPTSALAIEYSHDPSIFLLAHISIPIRSIGNCTRHVERRLRRLRDPNRILVLEVLLIVPVNLDLHPAEEVEALDDGHEEMEGPVSCQ